MSLWAPGFVPPASVLRMSNAVTVNPQSAKIRIHMTMTPLRIKEGHTGKTGSIITIQCTLGTVISPGALKDRTKHLKRCRKERHREIAGLRSPNTSGELPFYCPHDCIMFHVYSICNEKKTSTVGRWPHKHCQSWEVQLLHGLILHAQHYKALWIKKHSVHNCRFCVWKCSPGCAFVSWPFDSICFYNPCFWLDLIGFLIELWLDFRSPHIKMCASCTRRTQFTHYNKWFVLLSWLLKVRHILFWQTLKLISK